MNKIINKRPAASPLPANAVSKKLRIKDGQHAVVEPELTLFPLEYFHQIFSASTYQLINWHWHTGFQFCFVLHNTVDFHMSGSAFQLGPGDGLFINAQQVHAAAPHIENIDISSAVDNISSEYISLNIPTSFLGIEGSELFRRFVEPVLLNSDIPFIIFRRDDSSAHDLLDLLRSCCISAGQDAGSYGLELLSELILLWNELIKMIDNGSSALHTPISDTVSGNKRLQTIISYLNENYMHNITLDDIAAHIYISRSECSRFFRQATGQTLFGYLTQLRISRSCELLMSTDMSVSDIAYACGFSSQSYFSQRFRHIKGVSPEQFRRQRQN